MKKSLVTLIFLASVFTSFAQHPSNLSSVNITSNSAELSWDASTCSGNVNLKYRVTGTGANWTQVNGVISNYILNGLNPNTSYDWTVKCVGTSGWANNATFTTTIGCNLISTVNITDASCSNTLNGSVVLTVSNGTPPYNFSWDNGDTTQNLSGVLAGTYTVIYVDSAGCTDTLTGTIGIDGATSIQQNLSIFLPNPITSYNEWSFDTLQMINTDCEVRVRPEFEVSCSAGAIQQGDIKIKWMIPGQTWSTEIPYTINSNGNAEGFWSQNVGDSTGYILPYSGNYTLIIKVKFSNPPGTAQHGTYTAYWETFEVDNLGNKIGSLSPQDTVSLSFIDPCSAFSNNITVNGTNRNIHRAFQTF